MRTPTWKPQLLTEKDGFTFTLSFEPDDLSPKDHFINTCGWTEKEFQEVNNCYFFAAKVTAYLGSIECGDAYLGCCMYKNLKEAMGDSPENVLSGYALALIDEALDDAKTNTTKKLFTQ